ncbi:MAG: hypothetical protein HYS07_01445 [Chlamydiae bacterium]|nr:hypothetical protein [Chlamydiota bacterium]MBI3277790.1 hypothetical protein [Chlamydiota bacterium]
MREGVMHWSQKALILAVLFSSPGCATMMRASHETLEVQVHTDPAGAIVKCSGQTIETPGSLSLHRSQDHVIYIEKPGYKRAVVHLRSRPSGGDMGASFFTNTATVGWWTLGIGTVAGMAVDAVSGSMNDLETTSLLVKLEPGEGEVHIEASDLIQSDKKKRRK